MPGRHGACLSGVAWTHCWLYILSRHADHACNDSIAVLVGACYLFPTCTWERSTSFFLRKTSNSSPSNTLLRWSRRDNPFSSFPCCCDHSPLTLVPTSCKGVSSRVLNEARERRESLHRGTALETFNVSCGCVLWVCPVGVSCGCVSKPTNN